MEHKHTVGSTLLLLTLDDPVALDRLARHPGARAVLDSKLGERHGLTTEASPKGILMRKKSSQTREQRSRRQTGKGWHAVFRGR